MMKILFLIVALLGMLGCGNATTPAVDSTVGDSLPVADTISLDEAIGNMLLVGFRGTTVDSTNHIWRDIKKYHVGSVILFDYDAPTGTRGRNIKSPAQVKALCAQLHALSADLLIGIDQEGGNVSRLSTRYGFPPILSAQKSAVKGPDTVRHYAHLTAEMLHDLGINLNFAPVADVNVNPSCPVIGAMGRSFSDRISIVKQCCSIWIEEQRKLGVASCLKHFPGHGSAKGDTHKGLVDVTETWQRFELAPYRQLCAPPDSGGVPEGGGGMMVMTAHVINRQLDPSGLPASLSPKITSYLRDTLGFQGIIVTDDLAMGAITGQYTLEKTIRMALEAGADLLCLSNNGGHGYDPDIVPKVVKIIHKLINEGVVTPERIYASGLRVRELRESLSATTR